MAPTWVTMIYSGTVAAATEGFLLHPRHRHFAGGQGYRTSPGGAHCRELVERFQQNPVREPDPAERGMPDLPCTSRSRHPGDLSLSVTAV